MNTNTETQTTNATQTESGEKFFTQEQVNQIVSERLARERSKANRAGHHRQGKSP